MKFQKGGRRCARETKTESLAACGDGGRILETRRDEACRVRQIKFAQWYTGASELFSSMYVTINFYNGIYVKDSYVLGVFRI